MNLHSPSPTTVRPGDSQRQLDDLRPVLHDPADEQRRLSGRRQED